MKDECYSISCSDRLLISSLLLSLFLLLLSLLSSSSLPLSVQLTSLPFKFIVAAGGRGFAWRPGIADAVQTWNLARTICPPLKPMSNPTKAPPLTDLAAVHGKEAERMILQCPDLQVLVPSPHLSLLLSAPPMFSISWQKCNMLVRLQHVSAVMARAHASHKLIPIPWKISHLESPIW